MTDNSHLPIRYTDTTMWEEIQEQAAHLVALGEHTDRSICEQMHIEPSDLARMRATPKFLERVHDIREDINFTLIKQGIANKQARINAMQARHRKIMDVFNARAEDPDMKAQPGGDTGILTKFWKNGKTGWMEEYQIDYMALAELRAIEMQTAKELGQWIDKQEINSTSRQVTVAVIAEIDKYDAIFSQALRLTAGENASERGEPGKPG